jgi:hypothetical protein
MDEDGQSMCGIGDRVTCDKRQVTCRRCQLYTRQTPLVKGLLRWL